MLANAAAIAGAVEIPVIADADTGYGGTMNVRRTIREYERTGVAAVHIEDQQFPQALRPPGRQARGSHRRDGAEDPRRRGRPHR